MYGFTYDATWRQVENLQDFLFYIWEQAKSYEFSIPYYNYKKFELSWVNVLNEQKFIVVWSKSPKFIETLEVKLKDEFNSKAAEVYFKLKLVSSKKLIYKF